MFYQRFRLSDSLKRKAFSLIELSIVVLIIGILIAGVTQGSRLVNLSRIKTAQSQTNSSGINSISGLVAWFETTSDNSFITTTNGNNPEDGDLISAWNDVNSSQTSTNFTINAAASYYPKYKLNSISGLPSVAFEGSSYFLGKGMQFSDITIFMVLKINNPGSLMMLISNQGAFSGNSAHIGLESSLGNRVQYTTPNSPSLINNKVITDGKPHIITARDNGASRVDILVDGANQVTTNSNLPTTDDLTNFAIGVWYVDSSNISRYLNGNIAEIIIFNRALKFSEITDINNYLAKKYNIR